MSVVISHMRAAATLDESARLIADHLRSMAEYVSKCPPSVRKGMLHRWAAKLEDAVEIANDERTETELEDVPMLISVERMADELRKVAAERAGSDKPLADMTEWQAAKRLEEYEAERRWLINENTRLRALNASHLARVARAEDTE
jgi:hypothetical protein